MKFSAAVKLLADRFSKFFTLPTGANAEKKTASEEEKLTSSINVTKFYNNIVFGFILTRKILPVC